ncbi:MAG: purine phosphorylase [Pseudomonadota bacterium]|nr:MAG: purine phosphorylase [Pseudomonadota bacterium]
MKCLLGVVTALPAEGACLAGRRVNPLERVALDDAGWMEVAGIGANRAACAAQTLVASGATALLSWGVAGGLESQLAAGALVVPRTVTSADGVLHQADSLWRARVEAALGSNVQMTDGALVESEQVLTTVAEKQALFERSGAAAVDMESAAVARVAADAMLPFLCIRAIVDSADRTLPAAALVAVDETGRPRAGRLLGAVLRRPSDLVALIALSFAMKSARKTLKDITLRLGPALGSDPDLAP